MKTRSKTVCEYIPLFVPKQKLKCPVLAMQFSVEILTTGDDRLCNTEKYKYGQFYRQQMVRSEVESCYSFLGSHQKLKLQQEIDHYSSDNVVKFLGIFPMNNWTMYMSWAWVTGPVSRMSSSWIIFNKVINEKKMNQNPGLTILWGRYYFTWIVAITNFVYISDWKCTNTYVN